MASEAGRRAQQRQLGHAASMAWQCTPWSLGWLGLSRQTFGLICGHHVSWLPLHHSSMAPPVGSSLTSLPHLELRCSLKARFLEYTLLSTKLLVAPVPSCGSLVSLSGCDGTLSKHHAKHSRTHCPLFMHGPHGLGQS